MRRVVHGIDFLELRYPSGGGVPVDDNNNTDHPRVVTITVIRSMNKNLERFKQIFICLIGLHHRHPIQQSTMNYSSPDGGISNRVSISGTKRPRERSDSTDEGTEATATTACPIFLKYDEIFENLAEDLVRKCEAQYKLSLTECNNVLESQRIALRTCLPGPRTTK